MNVPSVVWRLVAAHSSIVIASVIVPASVTIFVTVLRHGPSPFVDLYALAAAVYFGAVPVVGDLGFTRASQPTAVGVFVVCGILSLIATIGAERVERRVAAARSRRNGQRRRVRRPLPWGQLVACWLGVIVLLSMSSTVFLFGAAERSLLVRGGTCQCSLR
jgi:hypothetical protein